MLPTLERCAAVPKRTTTQHHTPLVPPHRQTSSAKPPNQRVGNGSSSSSSSSSGGGGDDDDDETHAVVSHFCLRSSLLSPRPPVLSCPTRRLGGIMMGRRMGTYAAASVRRQGPRPSIARPPARRTCHLSHLWSGTARHSRSPAAPCTEPAHASADLCLAWPGPCSLKRAVSPAGVDDDDDDDDDDNNNNGTAQRAERQTNVCRFCGACAAAKWIGLGAFAEGGDKRRPATLGRN
ncbi:hypothetical protein Purlil1_1000 [Purpureocillium lilacinum]|uniref:Uncharacterized protein n=1 Tax=Purpureocillium lilacinum TaxID=33203 RepID=A0ABR0CDS2_PURLI|nr:hypothetical protein Purlil1_1000 [Purpureocillium lilacinum]